MCKKENLKLGQKLPLSRLQKMTWNTGHFCPKIKGVGEEGEKKPGETFDN